MHRLKINLEAIEHENEANKESEEGMCDSGVRVGSLLISSEGISTLGGPSFVLSLQDLKFFSEAEGGFLGKGSSGAVRRALHLQTGKVIALKEIKYTSIEHLTEIRRELETLYTSGVAPCPHLVDFYGACSYDGSVFIAMECMDGSLDVIRKPVPHRVLAEITRQILRGLVYLHRTRHLIHRDLKPSNVLFNRHTGEIKISDFGVSSYLECTKGGAQSFIGTVTYMSPERLKGDVYSYAADIWSLGLVVAELALGKFPFDDLRGDSTEARFWALVQHFSKDKPVVLLPHDLPHELTEFINLCVRKDPDQRPSCSQLLRHAFLTRTDWEKEEQEECPSRSEEQKSSTEHFELVTSELQVKHKNSEYEINEQTYSEPSTERTEDINNGQNSNNNSADTNSNNNSNITLSDGQPHCSGSSNKELLRRWLNTSSESQMPSPPQTTTSSSSSHSETARINAFITRVEHHDTLGQISSNNEASGNTNGVNNHSTNKLEAVMERYNSDDDNGNAEVNETSNLGVHHDECVVQNEETCRWESYPVKQDENNNISSNNHADTTTTYWSNSCNMEKDVKCTTNAPTVNESTPNALNKTFDNVSNPVSWHECMKTNGETNYIVEKQEEYSKDTKNDDDAVVTVNLTNQHSYFQFGQVNNESVDSRSNQELHLSKKQHHSHRHHEHRRHYKSLHTRYSSPRHVPNKDSNLSCHTHYLYNSSNDNNISSNGSCKSNSTGSSCHNSDVLMHLQPVIVNEPQPVLNLDEELSKLLL